MTFPSDLLPDHPHYNCRAHLLYVQQLHADYPLNTEEKCDKHAARLLKPYFENRPPWYIGDQLLALVEGIMHDDDIYIPHPPTLEYAPYLTRIQGVLTDQSRTTKAETAVKEFLDTFIPALPDGLEIEESQSPHVPLIDLLPHAEHLVAFAMHCFALPRSGDDRIFRRLANKVGQNSITASGHDPEHFDGKKKIIRPEDAAGTPSEVVQRYLADTPFIQLLFTLVPFTIPRRAFRAHGCLFAPTDHGKTQTLQSIIVSFLKEADPPPMFIMDSMGSMLKKLERLDVFDTTLKDRIVILDPADAPALNFFKLKGGSDAQQMELFFYLFKAIEQGLTPRQATMVSYLVELMRVVDGASLHTLREVCEAKHLSYAAELSRLPQITQDFFTNQFLGKDPLVNGTKQQIAQRLYAVGKNQIFNAMFSARENKFDAYDCIQQKKIVLVNTDRKLLGEHGSAIFGRYIIAQCLAAALARSDIPETERHLALLICDEAKAYVDDQTETILSDARQFGLGMLLATQAPHQLPEGVRREIATNTAIKMMGAVDYSTANQMSRDMHTTPQFIQGMKSSDRQFTEFATYVRNVTPTAIKLTIPMGILENEPTMSDDAVARLRAANKAKYGAGSSVAARQPDTASRPPQPPAKINAGEIEPVSFPDYGFSLNAFLDTGAELSMLHVADLIITKRDADAFAQFTVTGKGGVQIRIERPIKHMKTNTGYGAGTHPVVSLTIRFGEHITDEHFSLILSSRRDGQPVLLGSSFLAGRARIDSKQAHTGDAAPSPPRAHQDPASFDETY